MGCKPFCWNWYDDVPQVVERLEADLGVQVQEVCFPELSYSFQIWDTYMSLPDDEGNVGPDPGHNTDAG